MSDMPATTVIGIEPVHVFRTGGAGKYDGTVHEGIEMFLVGYLLQSDLHRQVQRDFVSGFPFAANRQVLARLGVYILHFAIDGNTCSFCP